MAFSSTTTINMETRGNSIDPAQLVIAKKLISIAHELQRRFTVAEKSLLTFSELIDNEPFYESIDNTYEAHVVATLRIQLFRILIVDLWGCVFDEDSRTGSVRSILKELRRCNCALDSLKAFYTDTDCLNITFDGEITEEQKEHHIEMAKNRHVEEKLDFINNTWEELNEESAILDNIEAKRLKWLRHKIIVHYEKTETGLHVYNDTPPDGEGPITWMEPVIYFNSVRDYVYKVFLLLTSTSWDSQSTAIDGFYSKAFWDRFANGETKLEPTGL